jgi:hypothetical protein
VVIGAFLERVVKILRAPLDALGRATSVCSPPGQRQERREQDALARERLDDAGGLELLRLPPFPIVGLPNSWVTS